MSALPSSSLRVDCVSGFTSVVVSAFPPIAPLSITRFGPTRAFSFPRLALLRYTSISEGSMVRQRRDESRQAGIMDAQGDQQQMPPRPGDDFRRYGIAALFLTAAGYGLREAKFLQTLLWDKRVNRPALLFFMLSSSVVVALWGYLDVYVGWIQRQRVMYSEARQVTHAILLSILVAGICLNVALWPVYHGWSPVLVFMFSYGVLFQLITLFPAQLYNPLFFCAFAAFVYVYTNQ